MLPLKVCTLREAMTAVDKVMPPNESDTTVRLRLIGLVYRGEQAAVEELCAAQKVQIPVVTIKPPRKRPT